jgi:hypothetical protein
MLHCVENRRMEFLRTTTIARGEAHPDRPRGAIKLQGRDVRGASPIDQGLPVIQAVRHGRAERTLREEVGLRESSQPSETSSRLENHQPRSPTG